MVVKWVPVGSEMDLQTNGSQDTIFDPRIRFHADGILKTTMFHLHSPKQVARPLLAKAHTPMDG
jgi:hypothetical protein